MADAMPIPRTTRRHFFAAAGAASVALPASTSAEARQMPPRPTVTEPSLREGAATKGLAFGTAVNITSLRNDPAYGPAIARDCGMVVAENEMKMEYVEMVQGRFTHEGGDAIATFATAHDQSLRGTTLVWHRGMPPWAFAELAERRGERLMRRWIESIAGRYRGRIESWDVVNEAIDPKSGRRDGLRETPWLKALGPSYIDLAFGILHQVDPGAGGLWNEEDVCLGAGWMEARRTAVLKAIESRLARGVPIRRFGLQSHLNSLIPLDEAALRRFLAHLAGMGLAIEITELDVDDRAFPGDEERRDRAVANFAERYLDVVLDQPAVLNVLTWDILDPNTWLNHSDRKRPDQLPQRSLPLDAAYRRKPLWYALRDAFLHAPDHSASRRKARIS